MKNKNLKISANEINRFIYCPYQWYYGRYYGQTVLKEKYKALSTKKSKHEQNFAKGIKFHRNYYRHYRVLRVLRLIAIGIVLIVIVGSLFKWLL